MSESALPANNMGDGTHVSSYDPLLKKAPLKRLREIIGKKKDKKES